MNISTFGVVLAYGSLAIVLVILNKSFFARFNVPFLTLWVQCFVSACLTQTAANNGLISIDFKRSTISALRDSFGINLVNGLSLVFASLALLNVDASVFQIVARSLTIPISVLLSRLFLGDRPSYLALFGSTIVAAGFASTIYLDAQISFTTQGLIFGAISAFVAALHSVLIKSATNRIQFSDVELVYYGNLFFVLTAWPLILYFESAKVLKLAASLNEVLVFMSLSLVTGAVAVAFNVAIILQVKITSPLSHTISSTVKGVFQNIICLLIFREPFTDGKLIGTLVVMLGTALYMLARQAERRATKNVQH